MPPVPPRQLARDPRAQPAVRGGARAGHAAGAEAEADALASHHPRLGVVVEEPGRRRRGGCTQVDADAGTVQQVDDAIHPGEVELTLPRLQQGPREAVSYTHLTLPTIYSV